MTLWLLPLVPIVGGLILAATGHRVPGDHRRLAVGGAGTGVLTIAIALAAWAMLTDPTASYEVGAGLALQLSAGPVGGLVALLVVVVAALVVAWGAAHEAVEGLGRLIGSLVTFAGVMLLVVLADDLVTLTVGWELVGVLSWALIGHRWQDREAPAAAGHAYNATRFGGLGLVLAAAATFAQTGSFSYDAMAQVDGAAAHAMVAGVLLAAVSKSALVPFSPWLFSAMAGPTAVSALLHSSTMVAAGAYALIRLEPALASVGWFGPTAIGFGLVTALAGGAVALLQGHAKKLLAASTSAQYGLMVVAIGAGYPAVALLHLVVHALFKAQLFLSAGVAMEAVGSTDLARMRLGRHLRWTARLTLVASLALAAVPPLGAAFTKEQVLAAASHETTWIGLLVALAGGLSAAYATRYQLLAFGADPQHRPSPRQFGRRANRVEVVTMAILAAGTIASGVVWLPPVHDWLLEAVGGRLPDSAAWEIPASLALVAVGGYVVWTRDRTGALGHVPAPGRARAAADWLGLPTATRRLVVAPTLAMAQGLARFDDRVVDGGVRLAARAARDTSSLLSRRSEVAVDAAVAAVAAAVARTAVASARDGERAIDGLVAGVARTVVRGGRDARRLQTGMVHHQYVVIAIGLVVVVAAATLGR